MNTDDTNLVKCLICSEFRTSTIVPHLRATHGISSKEYRTMYGKDAPVLSQSRAMRHKQQLIERNKNPEFIEAQRHRLSVLASNTNRRVWSTLSPEDRKAKGDAAMIRCLKQRIPSKEQAKVRQFIESLGESCEQERVTFDSEGYCFCDLYLPEFDFCIEINDMVGHVRPTESGEFKIDNMYQDGAVRRDLRKIQIFNGRILFLFHDEIDDDSYEEKLLNAIGHVKSGELLEPYAGTICTAEAISSLVERMKTAINAVVSRKVQRLTGDDFNQIIPTRVPDMDVNDTSDHLIPVE